MIAQRAIRAHQYPKRTTSLRNKTNTSPQLPDEILTNILSFLKLRDLLNCRRVSRRFLTLIKDSLTLQYRIELGHAALKELFQPLSIKANLNTTIQRLDLLRKQQFGWRNLAWRARHGISLDHPKGALYELCDGVFVSGKRRRPGVARSNEIVLQQLPYIGSKTVPTQAEINCQIGIAQVAFDIEQDLLVLLEEKAQRPADRGSLIFRLHLRSMTTNIIHPAASVPVLEYECTSSWSAYSYVMQIMGKSLGVLFTSGVLGNSDYERFVVWDWTTGVMRGMVFMPNSRYDSFSFISDDTFVIPCARTETINVFLFRPTPPPGQPDRGPAIHHLCALKLPTLNPLTGYKYISIMCQSQPTPEVSNFYDSPITLPRPKKLFTPDQEDNIIQFTVSLAKSGRTKELLIVTHRKALMSFVTSSQDDLGDPLTEPWESYPMMPAKTWGPDIVFPVWRAISRCILSPLSDTGTNKLRPQVHGHRMVQLVHNNTPRAGHIRVLDFNPLFVKRPPLFPEDFHPVIQSSVTRKIVMDLGVIAKGEIWMEDILSSLPYYEVTTNEMFPLSGLMMDDERIIGLKTGSPGNPDIVALDVFVM